MDVNLFKLELATADLELDGTPTQVRELDCSSNALTYPSLSSEVVLSSLLLVLIWLALDGEGLRWRVEWQSFLWHIQHLLLSFRRSSGDKALRSWCFASISVWVSWALLLAWVWALARWFRLEELPPDLQSVFGR